VSGTSVAASGGSAANTTGTLMDNADVSQGYLALDGNGDYLAFGTDVTGLRGLPAITIAAWIRLNTTASALRRIVEHDDNFYFFQQDGKFRFSIHGTGGTALISATTLPPNVWVHVAATWAHNGVARLYINGAVEATSAATSVAMPNNVQRLSFGAQRNNSATPTPTAFFDGCMDDVAVWDTALPAEAVAALAGVGIGGYAGRVIPTVLTSTPITLLPVMDVGKTNAVLKGLFNVPATAARLYWGTEDGGTEPAAWANVCEFGAAAAGTAFITNLTGLTAGIRYRYRFHAEDGSASGQWSAAGEFATHSILPDDLPGLQLWLRPDVGVTTNASGVVDVWADQSGHDRHAVRSGSSGTLRLEAGMIGGSPAVRFAGGQNNAYLSSSYTPEATDGLTVFVVAQALPQTSGGTIRPLVCAGPQGSGRGLFCIGGTRPWADAGKTIPTVGALGCFGRGYASAVPYSEFAATNEAPNFAPGAGHVAVMTLDAAASSGKGQFSAFFDGLTRRTAGGATATPTTGPVEVGGATSTDVYRYDGYIGDVIIYDRVLSGDELNAVGWYLQSRYGLAGYYQNPLVARVAVRAATAVSKTTAVLNAEILSLPTSVKAVFHWGEADGGANPAAWANSNVFGTVTAPGRVSAAVSGLSPGVTYCYRLRCENAAGETWTMSAETFTTWRDEPSDLAGLQFWLKADEGVFADAGITPAADGQPVAQWNDASGNDRHATRAGTVGSVTYSINNGINGLPAVTSTDIQDGDYLRALGYEIADTDDLTVFVVARQHPQTFITGSSAIKPLVSSGRAANGQGAFCIAASRWDTGGSATNALGYFGRSYSPAPPYPGFVTSGQKPTFEPNTIHIATLSLDAAANGGKGQFTGWFDGVWRSSNAGVSDNPQNGPVEIAGNLYNGFCRFSGAFGDILIYDRVLTEDERNRVGWYLQTKYGIDGAFRNPFATLLANTVVTSVTGTSATLAVDVADGDLPTTVMLHWGTTDGVWTGATNATVDALGAFSLSADGLEPGTIYFARFSAVNSQGEAWATETVTFTTVGPPIVAALPPNAVGFTSAALEGALIDTCGAPTTVWIYWGAADGGESPDAWELAIPFGPQETGAVSSAVSGLAENTAYFYRVYAENTYGARWSPIVRFTTAFALPPVVKTDNLVFWLRADMGVAHSNGLVHAWADQAGTSDAFSSGGARPLYVSDAINGRAALRFDGINDFLAAADHDALDLGVGAGKSWTLIAVYLREKSGTQNIVAKGTAGSNVADWRFFRDDTGVVWGTGPSADTNAWFRIAEPAGNQPHVLAGTLTQTGETSGVKAFSINGTAYVSEPYAVKAPANESPVMIGGEDVRHECLQGLIAEVMVFNKALNDDDLNNVGFYLQEKYGIPGLFEYRAPRGTLLWVK